MLPAIGSFSPPPPTPLEALGSTKALDEQPRSAAPPSSSGDGISPSLLVIAAIIVFVFVVSATIHLLLRFLSRHSSSFSSSSSSGASSPLVLLRRASSSSSSHSPQPARRAGGNDEQGDLIESLPLFTLASALAALPRSSPDCAVCLSRFHPHDQLRLLPSCRHAFHSTCIDTWLRSTLSCPLCRSPVLHGPPPLPPPAPPRVAAPEATTPAAGPAAPTAPDRSGSFRVEIGSVSRRRTSDAGDPVDLLPPPHSRSYSLGSSFQYVVEEEVEAVVAAVAAHVRQQRRKEEEAAKDVSVPAPPGEEVAEAAGGSRSWLRDYVDRLTSSASSSFSSLRFSACGSGRVDGGGNWPDLEASHRRRSPEDDEEDGAGAYYHSFYRWLMGA